MSGAIVLFTTEWETFLFQKHLSIMNELFAAMQRKHLITISPVGNTRNERK